MLKRLVLCLILLSIVVACSVLEQSSTLTPTQSPSNTPDAFSLTVTQLIFEATSGTLDARHATSRMTDEARATVRQATHQAESLSATANYWATEGITPTLPPVVLTDRAMIGEQTQVAETAVANGCLALEHSYQGYTFYYHIRGNVEVTTDDGVSFFRAFDCPDLNDRPYELFDIFVDVVVPSDADENELRDIITQAIMLLTEYPPPGDSVQETDNVSMNTTCVSCYPYSDYNIQFSYSDMLSALDDGLEGEALLEALGGG